MIVLATNISEPVKIIHKGKEEETGYFKKESESGIFLGKTDVKNDFVGDRLHHGGTDKACYLYGFNHYSYWQAKYPELEWSKGMFGENLTMDELDESEMYIGDTYQLGEAVIQISQPRQPCYKMGIRFQDPEMPNNFRLAPFPGIYARVLETGSVRPGDKMILKKRSLNKLSVLTVFELLYAKDPDNTVLQSALSNPDLANRTKEYLKQKFKL